MLYLVVESVETSYPIEVIPQSYEKKYRFEDTVKLLGVFKTKEEANAFRDQFNKKTVIQDKDTEQFMKYSIIHIPSYGEQNILLFKDAYEDII